MSKEFINKNFNKKIISTALVFVVIFYFFIITHQADAAVLVQKASPGGAKSVDTSTTSCSVTTTALSPAAVAGHLLVVVVGVKNPSVSISGPAGFSIALNENGVTYPGQGIFYKIAAGGETTVTASSAAGCGSIGVQLYEYSGANILQTTGSNTGTSTAPDSGLLTTIETNQLIFAAFTDGINTVHNEESPYTGDHWNTVGGFTEQKDDKTTSPGKNATYAGGDMLVNTAGVHTTRSKIGASGVWRGQIVSFLNDITAPVIAQVTAVPSPTNDNTPNYTFSSTEAGTITYGGDCSSATTAATVGNNTVTFNALSNGIHSNCTIKVTDAASNQSSILAVNTFTIDTIAPTITSITRAGASLTNASSVYFTVLFSESVSGIATSDFVLTTTGVTGSAISSVSVTSGSSVTVSVSTGMGSGTIRLDVPGTATLIDIAGNNVSNIPFTSGEIYTIDKTPPILAEITAVPSPTNDNTPNYTFSSTEAGSITYAGDCSSITISATSGNNTITFNTLADGAHSNCTIKVTDGAGNGSNLLAVSIFTVDTTAPATKFVILDPTDAMAGDDIIVTVQVEDATNNVVTIYQTDVTLTADGSTTGDGLVNIINGVGTITLNNIVAETVNLILVDSEGTGLNIDSTQSVTWAPGPLDHFDIDSILSPQIAGELISATITAKDAFGNLVVNFTDTANFSVDDGSISPLISNSFSGGTLIQDISVTKAGIGRTVTATSGGKTGQVSFDVIAGAADKFTLDNPGNMVTGTRLGYTVTRYDEFNNLDDTDNNTVYLYTSSITGKFYDAETDGNEITSIVITDGNETAEFWYYDDTAGTWDITASDSGVAPGDGSTGIDDATDSVIVSITPIVATKWIFYSVTPGSPVVGETVTVIVRAVDGSNNLDNTFQDDVKFKATGNATGNDLTIDVVNGVGSINLTDILAETVSISLENISAILTLPSAQNLTFSPGPLDHFDIASVSTQIEGVPFDLVITAKDAFSNIISNFTGTTNISIDSGLIVPIVSNNFVAGSLIQSVTVTGAGVEKIITVENSDKIGEVSVDVNPAEVDIIATKYIIIDPADAATGATVEVTVKAVNNLGFTDIDVQDDVTLVIDGPATGGGVVSITDGEGTVSITNTSAGTVNLSLLDQNQPVTGLDVTSTQSIIFSTASSGGGGGGSSQPVISFTGQAFPSGLLTAFVISEDNIPIKQDIIKSGDGKFALSFSSSVSGFERYGIFVRDPNGLLSQAKIYTLERGVPNLSVEGLVMSPTIGLRRNVIGRGDFLSLAGYSSPGSKVAFEIDGNLIKETTLAGTNGAYNLLWNTANLAFGQHTVRVRQTTTEGFTSEFSPTKSFSLKTYIITSTDLNSDGVVNFRDASIFLSLWYNVTNAEARAKIDFNSDSKIDLQDLAIFLRTLKKS